MPHSVEKHGKSSIWPKLCKFSNNYHVFAFRWTFQEKVAKSASFREKTRKTIDLAKTCNFSRKLWCLGIFMNFSERSCRKCLISWKSTRNHRSGQIFITFRTNYHVFACRWTFQRNVAKTALFREKAQEIIDLGKLCNFSNKLPCLCISINFSGKSCKKCLISWKGTKNHRFGQNFELFEQTTMSWHFHELFSKKLQKVPYSVQKHEKSSIWPKLCNFFEQTTMSLHFDQLFGKKLQKVPHFVKQHEKSLIWPKLCNFWNKLQCLFPFDELSRKKLQKVRRLVKKHEKSSILSTCKFPRKLPCFDVSMNIAAKRCKRLFVPWKSTKNHQFGQIFATFRTNFDVFAFRWIFKEKVAKSASFREKARKLIDLAKTLQLFEQTTMFWHFDEVFSKKLQKVPHFVKKHEKSSIWRKLATFPANYHVLTLWWTFQRKVAESASFREKARTLIGLAKTCNFSNKVPCFGISMNFSGKKCKKWPVSWKSTNTHRFGQNLQLFEQSTMFWHFDELFRKKMQKVARFVKKHEHSSIWPKLATSRRNYHVLAFRWLLQEKVAKRWKKWLISWKMTKNHRFGLNLQLFEETTMFRRFCQLFSKKWVISRKSTKNRHSEVA